MITEEDVLKAIVDCKNPNGSTDYRDIMGKLDVDDISLLPLLKELNRKGYIIQTVDDVSITDLGLSAYNELKPQAIIKKSIFKFSKFTFQHLIDICIGIIIGLAVSAIAHHFGW